MAAARASIRSKAMFQLEHQVIRVDGSLAWASSRAVPLLDENGEILEWFGTITDITARKVAAQIAENRMRFERLLADLSATIVCTSGRRLDSAIRRCLENMVEFLGVDRVSVSEFSPDKSSMTVTHSCAGPGITPLPIHVITAEELPWYIGTILEGNTVVIQDVSELPEDAVRERQWKAKTGVKSLMAFPLRVDDAIVGIIGFASLREGRSWPPEILSRLRLVGEVFASVILRKRTEEALHRERRTLRHMLGASDRERQLIAYDIHDGLAQQLAGAIMQFQAYDVLRDTRPEEARKAYEGGVDLLRRGHAETRRLISGIRPPILDEAGVVSAVSHLVNEQALGRRPKIEFFSRVRFSRLVPTLENAIYRIVQEGFTNACQHSQSERVRISLLQRDERLRIAIRDWGIGFDTKAARENGYGLPAMRERARLLGGRFRIRSKPNEGTLVRVEVPIVERMDEE